MKTIKSLSAVLLIALSAVLSSCLSTDSKGITVDSNYVNLFSAVVGPDGEMSIYTGQSVKVVWGYGDPLLADVNLLGVKIPEMGSFPSLDFFNVPWKVNNKAWMEISLTNAKPDMAAGFVSNLVFDRFSLMTVNRTYNGSAFPPCLNISYTIDNKYQVFTFPAELIEVGATTVTNVDTGESFKQDEKNRSIYYVEMDPANKTCFLVIQGAQFASNMPGLNMKFAGIPMTVNPNGTISMFKDELTPSLVSTSSDINQAGTPAPGYPITEFKASYIPETGLNISFLCTPHTKDGVPMGTYKVDFVCQYPVGFQDANL